MQCGDVAANADLHLASNKINLHARAALEIERRRGDETSGEAEVENFAPEEQGPVGDKDLGISFTGKARMTAAVGQRGIHSGMGKRGRNTKSLAFHRSFLSELAPYQQGIRPGLAFFPLIGGVVGKMMRSGSRT